MPQPKFDPALAEVIATAFHEHYERLAPQFGYETRPDTRAFDPTTPNGQLMVATVAALFDEGVIALPAGPVRMTQRFFHQAG